MATTLHVIYSFDIISLNCHHYSILALYINLHSVYIQPNIGNSIQLTSWV